MTSDAHSPQPKHSLRVKLDRYIDWESLAKGCLEHVGSCNLWDTMLPRMKWSKS